MIDIITPTGDRPLCFTRCIKWMQQQTIKESVHWIIVDDGQEEAPIFSNFPKNWKITYLRRQKESSDPYNTQGVNILKAIDKVESSKVVMIEDDDYYHKDWLSTASELLNYYDIVGKSSIIYYNILNKSYHFTNYFTDYPTTTNPMVQTAFRSSHLATLKNICEINTIQIDNELWQSVKGSKYLLNTEESLKLVIGIKGMPGRPGVTLKHTIPLVWEDPFLENFKEFLGEDHIHYLKFFN